LENNSSPEGFVIRYGLASKAEQAGRLIFISEDVASAPPGFQARYIMTRGNNDDEFEEIFEVANPGEDFSELIRNHWTHDQR
jgi:hypothetical protein